MVDKACAIRLSNFHISVVGEMNSPEWVDIASFSLSAIECDSSQLHSGIGWQLHYCIFVYINQPNNKIKLTVQ